MMKKKLRIYRFIGRNHWTMQYSYFFLNINTTNLLFGLLRSNLNKKTQ